MKAPVAAARAEFVVRPAMHGSGPKMALAVNSFGRPAGPRRGRRRVTRTKSGPADQIRDTRR